MSEPRPLHKLFGLTWRDFFEGTPVGVEMELDLSQKKQLLDVVFTFPDPKAIPRPMPDGFDDLRPHNLISFKSHQEALDEWALFEHVAHFVNYRKQRSPSLQNLLPESDFQLYAVCVRYPRDLAQRVTLTRLRAGVYEVLVLSRPIRVIVVNELPEEQQNAMLHLFSTRVELLSYGQTHYRPYSEDTSTVLIPLYQLNSEDPNMADTLKEFARESLDKLLANLPPEKLRKYLSPKQRVEGLSAEELAQALTPEARAELLRQLQPNGSSPKEG